jgi:signal transduction histidine kinase
MSFWLESGEPGRPIPVTRARRTAIPLIVAMMVAGMALVWNRYREDVSTAGRMLQALSAGTAYNIASALHGADALLMDASNRFNPPAPWDDSSVSHFLTRLRGVPFLHDMIVVGADGRILPPNLTANAAVGVDLSDREYFRFHRDRLETDDPHADTLHVAQPVVSRITGHRIMPVSRALRGPDGAFAGVIGAAIDIDYLEQVLAAMNFQPGSSSALLRCDGTILARVPALEPAAGTRVLTPLEPIVAQGGFQLRRVPYTLDGQDRFIGYRPVAPYCLVVNSTLLASEALKVWRDEAWKTGGVVLLLSLGVYLLAAMSDRRQAEQIAQADMLSAHRQRLEREVADRTGHLVAARAEAQHTADRLAESNALLEQFAYVASHDMRQPLRTISSYIGLMEQRLGPDSDPELLEYMAFAKDGARRMDRQICDLLDYSRIGRDGRSMAPVALGETVGEVVRALSGLIAESGATVDVAGPLPQVMGNRGELGRLFLNLIGNALKYRAPGVAPRVVVCAVRSGEHWEVTVADNGIGIAPRFFDRIFNIFQRLHTNAEYEGTGIGLAVCKRIVEHHGGRIRVESEPGQGSRFLFTLVPAAPADAGAAT